MALDTCSYERVVIRLLLVTGNGVTSADYGNWPGSFRFVSGAVGGGGAGIFGGGRPPQAAVQPDPGSLLEYRDRIGQSFAFEIVGAKDGIIWGDQVYTDDSPIATAAVHGGIVKPGEKAIVRVTILPPQGKYEGSTANGVTSYEYGPFSGSYRFQRARRAGGPAALGDLAVSRRNEYQRDQAKADGERTRAMEVVGTTQGSVWGTDVYTDDSSIAAAAVHAGILKDGEKGVVKITILPGQDSYAGSTRNGVTSASFGAWQGSFRVERANYTTKLRNWLEPKTDSKPAEPSGETGSLRRF